MAATSGGSTTPRFCRSLQRHRFTGDRVLRIEIGLSPGDRGCKRVRAVGGPCRFLCGKPRQRPVRASDFLNPFITRLPGKLKPRFRSVNALGDVGVVGSVHGSTLPLVGDKFPAIKADPLRNRIHWAVASSLISRSICLVSAFTAVTALLSVLLMRFSRPRWS